MDKETLVENDFEVEGAVVSALSRAQIPVTAVDWKWVSELGEWQLIVVTRLHDQDGPNAAYRQILDALSKAGWYNSFPIRRLFVKSPQDPVAQALVQELKHNVEGSVHINRRLNEPYTVVFARIWEREERFHPSNAVPNVTFEISLQKNLTFLHTKLTRPSGGLRIMATQLFLRSGSP
jgi:hypothetical protein